MAHEDFPKEWCGGEDCRFAAPQELTVECGGVSVRTADLAYTVPLSQLSRWNGDRPAICARNEKLNLCNPNNGDCSARQGLGLLIPEDRIEAMRDASAALCRARAREAMRYGQSVPGLVQQTASTAAMGGVGGGGIGGGGASSAPPAAQDAPQSPVTELTAAPDAITPGAPFEPTPTAPSFETLMLGPPVSVVGGEPPLSAVPLPGAAGALLIGLGMLAALRARRAARPARLSMG
jgi:hypothetical protein